MASPGFNPHAAGNLERGKAGEAFVVDMLRRQGYDVIRYGKGADFKAISPKGRTYYVEVKTGAGTLTVRQELERLRRGPAYIVVRL